MAANSSTDGSPGEVRLFSCPLPSSHWTRILLLEDNSARAGRRQIAGISSPDKTPDVLVRIHSISAKGIVVAGQQSYAPGSLPQLVGSRGRAALALELL